MARVKLGPLVEGARGAIGNIVLRQYVSGTIISRKPVFINRTFSEAQKASQRKFRKATMYAKCLMADPQSREAYEEQARRTGKPILSLMIGDYLRQG